MIKSNFGAKCEMIVNYIDNRTRKSISMVVIILFWLHNFYSLKDCIQHFAAWSSSDLTVFKKDWLVCVENIVGLRFRLNFFTSSQPWLKSRKKNNPYQLSFIDTKLGEFINRKCHVNRTLWKSVTIIAEIYHIITTEQKALKV